MVRGAGPLAPLSNHNRNQSKFAVCISNLICAAPVLGGGVVIITEINQNLRYVTRTEICAAAGRPFPHHPRGEPVGGVKNRVF